MIVKTGIIAGILLFLATAGSDARRGPHPFFETLPRDGAWVVAHRGGAFLWPENTLYAFGRALERGVHILEMDVRMTADGVPVVIHDERVDRTTNGHGRVGDMTFEALRRLDAGHHWSSPAEPAWTPYRGTGLTVPSLREVFETFPETLMVVEIKDPGREPVTAVGDLILETGREQTTLVASFHTRVLKDFRSRYPGVATSAGRAEVFRFWLSQKLFLQGLLRPGYDALQIPEWFRGIQVLSDSFLDAARRLNLSVQVWTVNDPADMARLFLMGIDAVVTDAPDISLDLPERLRTPAVGGRLPDCS